MKNAQKTNAIFKFWIELFELATVARARSYWNFQKEIFNDLCDQGTLCVINYGVNDFHSNSNDAVVFLNPVTIK